MRRTAIVYLGLAFLQRGASLLLLPFVTRAMSPSDYGAVSLLATGGILVGIVVGAPFEQAVYRWSIDHRFIDGGDKMVRAAGIWLRYIAPGAVLIVAIALFLLPGTAFSVDNRLWSAELVAAGFGISSTYLALPSVRAQERLRAFSVIAGVSVAAFIVTKVLLVIVLHLGPWGWVISDLIVGVAGFIASIIIVRIPKSTVERITVRSLARYVIPLTPHVVAFWALGSLARPLVALSFPLAAVGLYSVALNLANIGLLAASEFNRAVLVEYGRDTTPGLSPRTLETARKQLIVAGVLPIGVSGAYCATASFLLPSSFAGVADLVGVLSLIALFYGIYLVPMNVLTQTAGITGKSWIASVSGTALILGLTNILGAHLGLTAVAWLNIIGYAVMATAAFAVLRSEGILVHWRQVVPQAWVVASLIVLTLGSLFVCFWVAPGLLRSALGAIVACAAGGIALVAIRAKALPMVIE